MTINGMLVNMHGAERRTLAISVALIAIGGGCWYLFGRAKSCEVNETSATLYLNRLGVETMRAQFCWASDYRLVARR
jgi:hypothetical protein